VNILLDDTEAVKMNFVIPVRTDYLNSEGIDAGFFKLVQDAETTLYKLARVSTQHHRVYFTITRVPTLEDTPVNPSKASADKQTQDGSYLV